MTPISPCLRTGARLFGVTTVLLASLLAGRASAHEVENTHVLVTFSQGGTYQVEVLNDPDWLWLWLAADPGPLPSFEERDRQLAELEDLFTESVLLAFDGEPVAVTAEYLPPGSYDPSAPMGFGEPGTMRLTGQVPAGARTFQWAYGAVEDPYPMTILPPVGEPVTRWLMTAELSEAFVLAQLRPMTRAEVARQYLGLGFTHILPKGLDHILFVIGIFLLSTRLRPIVLQVTAFTVAHTITLGLTMYGVVSLSPSIVEPLIALSIAYVACENLVTSELKPWRVVLVFGFGLLHGMGFAGILAELGLPRSEFFTGLLTFNLGVEAGQLTVIAMAFSTVTWFQHKAWYRRRAVVPASLLIASIGLLWTVQRVIG